MSLPWTVLPDGGTVCISLPNGKVVEALMCAYEPACYDALCDFLPSGARIAEIGSFKGGSASIFVHGMRSRGKTCTLMCHDMFGPFDVKGAVVDVEQEFDATIAGEGHVIKIKGDSASTHAIHMPASLDAVFIDGDHSYRGALSDFRAFWPKVKEGGWFLAQDIIGECARAFNDFLDDLGPGAYTPVMFRPPQAHFLVIVYKHTDLEVQRTKCNDFVESFRTALHCSR